MLKLYLKLFENLVVFDLTLIRWFRGIKYDENIMSDLLNTEMVILFMGGSF